MPAAIRFVSAGAGSGKTWELTKILADELVHRRVQPSGVIATTFTRKAAAELRERVRARLIGEGAYALATAMGQARIGTVNSVCGELLARFAFEAGLPTELRVLDEKRAPLLLAEAIDEAIAGSDLTELLQIVRRLGLEDGGDRRRGESWREALRTLVDQARSNAIEADALRAFGEVNAQRLLEHFPAPTSEDLDARLARAIESVLPAVRKAAESNGVKKTAEYLALLEETLRELRGGRLAWSQWNKLAGAEPEKRLGTTVAPVAEAAARHPQHRRLHDDLRRYLNLVFALAADSLQAYAALKRQLGVIDFTDQEKRFLDILDHEVVAATLGEELELLMVDEFQDTSPIQLALFLKLADFAKQVVWVGDVKQAIYGFRGSDSTLMKAVVDALPLLNGAKSVLPYSWRSRPSLVGFVNELFGRAFEAIPPREVELAAKRDELPATAAIEDWSLAGENKDKQYDAIASGIATLIGCGERIADPDTDELRPPRLADVAVLARSNDAVREIATALTQRKIACSTAQPGLLAQPEVVLVLACLRRLNDDGDTLATAEIVALGDCEQPEAWLADRLAWLQGDEPAALWKERGAAHPIVATIAELRAQTPVLSPREAVELVLTRCDIARRVIQWQRDAGQARLRLANVDRLVELAIQYEDECEASKEAATLSGLLLWLQALAADQLDERPQPAVDAVHVLTHHGAKGLEWPIVVLCDLAADVKDRLWSIEAGSRSGFDAHRPLADRFIRYWPWPFGRQQKVAVAEDIEASAIGQAVRAEAIEEHKRLLYVSMTRARDVLVFARPEKKPDGEWMQTVSLADKLPAIEAGSIALGNGGTVSYRRVALGGDSAELTSADSAIDLAWLESPQTITAKLPLTVSPSSAVGTEAKIAEIVPIGSRIDVSSAVARDALGQAVHACIAADLIRPLEVTDVQAILDRMGMRAAIAAADLHRQLSAIRRWLGERWPGVDPIVELPLARVQANGQRVVGRTDLLLRTREGWILFDHKSTSQESAKWQEVANLYAGQLLAYGDVLTAVTKVPIVESWLILPIAGAAVRVELSNGLT